MFSRKHPYLFFILSFTLIFSLMIIMVSVFTSTKKQEFTLSSNLVGVIEITGVIEESKEVLSLLKTLREDNKVKVILLRIDSPGGAVGPSQEIYREVMKTREKKIIIASFGTIATSGAYYIGSATNGIIANSGTVTGSIGVIMGYANFKELLDKIGIKSKVIKSGEFKDIASPVREMSEKENAFLKDFVIKLHKQFVSDVSNGRQIPYSVVTELADGRIYTGEEALNLKLIDKIGNYNDALLWAGELGNIKGEIIEYYPPRAKDNFFERMINAEAILNKISSAIFKPSLYSSFLYQPAQ